MKNVEVVQNEIFKSIIGLPLFAKNEYVQGVIGYISQVMRSDNNKIGLLQHVLTNT